jgi:hypothetical protein
MKHTIFVAFLDDLTTNCDVAVGEALSPQENVAVLRDFLSWLMMVNDG